MFFKTVAKYGLPLSYNPIFQYYLNFLQLQDATNVDNFSIYLESYFKRKTEIEAKIQKIFKL